MRPNLRVRALRPFFTVGNYRLSVGWKDVFSKERPSLIHIHGLRNFESDMGAVLSAARRAPLVLTAHGTISPPTRIWGVRASFFSHMYDKGTFGYVLDKADAVVAASQAEKEELSRFGITKRKLKVIYHGIPMPTRFAPVGTHHSQLTVLIVSRLTLKNDLELAIRSFTKAAAFDRRLRLVVVGDEKPSRYLSKERGYKSSLLRLVKELGVSDRVEFRGWLYGEELEQSYLDADLFLWTSHYDNFAFAILEASARGLPIVTTPVGIAQEVVEGEAGGRVVHSRDESELGSAILDVTSDVHRMRAMGLHNKETATHYNIHRMAMGYLSLYKELGT